MVSDLKQVETASGKIQDMLKVVLQFVDEVLVSSGSCFRYYFTPLYTPAIRQSVLGYVIVS